jgi:hypothetical protein
MVGLCTDLVSPMTRGDTAIVVNSKEMAFAARESEMRNVALRKKIQLRAFVLDRSVWSLDLLISGHYGGIFNVDVEITQDT